MIPCAHIAEVSGEQASETSPVKRTCLSRREIKFLGSFLQARLLCKMALLPAMKSLTTPLQATPMVAHYPRVPEVPLWGIN
jgi:hypothetical protein